MYSLRSGHSSRKMVLSASPLPSTLALDFESPASGAKKRHSITFKLEEPIKEGLREEQDAALVKFNAKKNHTCHSE